jgi:hypothetical protein
MNAFYAKIRFAVDDEDKFNKYMAGRIPYWVRFADSLETAIRLSIVDAIEKNLCSLIFLTEFEPDNFDRIYTGWRSETLAPEMFRAMFSEEGATC